MKTEEKALTDLLETLQQIIPDLPDMKGTEKGTVQNSVNKIKKQLPEAFSLCFSLALEAVPCEDRKEYLKYSRDEIISRAKKK